MRCFDTITPSSEATRAELIRAVRDLGTSELKVECVPNCAPRSLFHAIAGCFQELSLTLSAISESLAEGVDITVGGSSPPPAQPRWLLIRKYFGREPPIDEMTFSAAPSA